MQDISNIFGSHIKENTVIKIKSEDGTHSKNQEDNGELSMINSNTVFNVEVYTYQ